MPPPRNSPFLSQPDDLRAALRAAKRRHAASLRRAYPRAVRGALPP
ncbi:hypothetical protein [Novosphingobium sp. YAF33]